MKVLVIGSGGREHALIWALNNSPKCEKIYSSPGNAGISNIAEQTLINLRDHSEVILFCKDNGIDLVVVGPEAPLVDGITDSLEQAGILVFGSSRKASQLEGSKTFMKEICKKYSVPTAKYESFTDAASALSYIENHPLPIVVKADGLAAGKGVIIAQNKKEAAESINEIFSGKFGDAGNRIVIEEFLTGEEISFFALVDGNKAIAFGSAQDHKTVGEGDTGPNTGGMGTYTPAPIMNPALQKEIMEKIITPTVDGMKAEGAPFKGVLFAGLMVDNGIPKLLEFNVRFGDPETQSLMARLDSDLLTLLTDAARGELGSQEVMMKDKTALCVVMAANGYPGSYNKGSYIKNLDEAGTPDDVIIFHAGTKFDSNKKIIANGGRVLGVTALGNSVSEAQQKAYSAVDKIDWPDGFCRRDIGWRAIEKEKVTS